MAALKLLLLSILGAAAITEDELYRWLYSSDGLNLGSADAKATAAREAPILTQCAVGVDDLTKLKAVLYSTSSLDYSMNTIRDILIPLAKQHVDPKELNSLFQKLYSTKGVDLSRTDAQSRSLELAKAYAEAGQVQELWNVLYSTNGVDLPKRDAQAKTLELAKAGCDPLALQNSFRAASGSKDDRLNQAVSSALRANLNGEARRYAKDGVAYDVKGFQDHYGAKALMEWADAPPEMRMAPDHKAYTASQFRVYFTSNWERYWHAAPVATQRRLAEDGKAYDLPDFFSWYNSRHEDWQQKWEEAPELPCKECSAALMVV
eukprot:CAMPEP_0181444646 /NCGR_PEP_ID=MMETSP1110-20121109/25178_1 /TAXON_ID=174948 /ORGANISM="Symbiodinium sp., Strain CCMP421" /LENGTH=318 /DNA_ID=CAMNT_0023568663 /DNA_START=62 /DNA_END=1018 /DNA_ORIENTATION=-